ncbi:MAG: 2-hydroxyacyl-CoA dehydratase family protein [Proteobacteria bacterium]|nr:2-hydroxyacyl-CoA dehydratase family protein [Pseudomonadota bacterium]MBU1710451.1 2-hydroxyacyl-CoA dehydratase family protein [Pseudomonadota bacterium]
MNTDRAERVRRSTALHISMEIDSVLQKIEGEFYDNPAAMIYFYDFFRTYLSEKFFTPSIPVIGTMCVQVPDEIIYALGARPQRICCGISTCEQVGAEFMPSKACPVVKATTGNLSANKEILSRYFSAIVIPSTCDQKRKSAETLSAMGYKVIMLEMPLTRNSDMAVQYWHESIKKLVIDLQKVTGKTLTSKNLQGAIGKVGQAQKVFRELYDLRKSDPPVITGKDVLMVNNAYFLDDIESWTDAVSTLNYELTRCKKKSMHVGLKNAPRILLTGSPPIFPNLKVPLMLEQSGAVIVADEVCSSTRLLYDTVAYDEPKLYDMVPAIADRYLKASTCPCFTPNDNRLRRLLEMTRDFRVDGVVYQAFSGCMPYEMEQKKINDMLAAHGIPMLYVETDYSPEDQGQLSTRIEAFIESIKARNRKAS